MDYILLFPCKQHCLHINMLLYDLSLSNLCKISSLPFCEIRLRTTRRILKTEPFDSELCNLTVPHYSGCHELVKLEKEKMARVGFERKALHPRPPLLRSIGRSVQAYIQHTSARNELRTFLF